MFKRLRIAFLLYILLFVAVGQLLTAHRSTNWSDTLWVSVYLINADGAATTQDFIDRLDPLALTEIETFFAREAAEFGLDLDQPFRIRVAGQIEDTLPPVPANGQFLSTVIWSLKMRWFVTRLHWSADGPTPDITVLANYSDTDGGQLLDRSTALRKGMIAVANLRASRSERGRNRMIIAHEVLHTLGATDKYEFATGLPLHPHGYVDPNRSPLYPQTQAELMAGRIPLDNGRAQTPDSLRRVVVGPETAAEIGWIESTEQSLPVAVLE